MIQGEISPPVVYAAPRVAADALAWSHAERGELLTVLAKIAFRWQHGDTCALLDEPAIIVRDRHHDQSPTKSLVSAADLVPWLPHPELILTGSAYAPRGRAAPALTVQLSLSRGKASYQKRLEVYGDRDESGARRPFKRMPLTWERALRTDDNLVGVAPTDGAPNILDPERPARPAGFGPISSLWRPRRAKLGELARPKLTREPVQLPGDFDGEYFQAAPSDQWLEDLVGDEWLALDGLSPVLKRVVTRLPGAQVAIKLVDANAGEQAPVRLSPDRLTLDSDAQWGTLSYRVVVPMAHARLRDLSILVGLQTPGQAVTWPEIGDARARCAHLGRPAGAAATAPAIEPLVDEQTRTAVRNDLPDLEDDDELLIPTTAMKAVRLPEAMAQPPAALVEDEATNVRDVDELPAQPSAPDFEEVTRVDAQPAETEESLVGVLEEEPFNETRAMRAVRGPLGALPFGEREPHADQSAGAEDEIEPDEPFSGTMALRPLRDPGEALPFMQDEGDDALEEVTVDEPPHEEEPFNETRAMRAVRDVERALPFPTEDPEEHTREHRLDQLLKEGRTVLPFQPEGPESEQPASGKALPFAPPTSPEAKRALLEELHVAATTPKQAKGAFEDDEHTALTSLPTRGGELPFGPAGSPPPTREPIPSAPPIFPRPAEPSAIHPDPRKRTRTLKGAGPIAQANTPDDPRDTQEETGPPPAGPERRSETVPWRAEPGLAVATVAWQVAPPQDSLTVIVKGSFDLQSGARATLRELPELPTGDVFADDDPEAGLLQASDFAIVKPGVDVLVRGHVHAPKKHTTVMQASLRLGAIDRRIAVIGDREWRLAGPSEPEPFEKMPIDYTRSFGGPGLLDNPVGVGHRGGKDATGAARMPNFELPDQLISAKRSNPAPASFGPISPTWSARWGLLGTYDVAWFDTRWPYFAADFDYGFFQAAPPDQRLDGLAGDESFELVGLHPEHSILRGSLPGLRARCYAQLVGDEDGAFIEVPVRLDTVTFDSDTGVVHLVWRGLLDVRDEDATEIEELFAIAEPLDAEPLTLESAHERYRAALAPEPEPESVPAPPPRPSLPEDEPESEGLRHLNERIEAMEASLHEDLHAAEIAAAEASPSGPTSLADLAERVRGAGGSDGDVAELVAAFAEEDVPAPEVDLRALVQTRIARGEPLSNLSLRGADLSRLDLSGQSLDGCDLTGAQLEGTNVEGADMSGANLSQARLVELRGAGVKLTDADLTDAVLDRANLNNANLDRAALLRARASRADFRQASARRASFTASHLEDAIFDGAKLHAADFSRASFARASFVKADLEQVRLYDATGESATFEAARMTGARAEGVMLARATFTHVHADGSVWELAELSGASFRGASLVDASFVRAICRETIFAQSDLRSGRLRKSVMAGAFFSGANLMDATCERADFSHVDFRDANLHGTVFNQSSLREANLDGAILSYSTIGRKQP